MSNGAVETFPGSGVYVNPNEGQGFGFGYQYGGFGDITGKGKPPSKPDEPSQKDLLEEEAMTQLGDSIEIMNASYLQGLENEGWVFDKETGTFSYTEPAEGSTRQMEEATSYNIASLIANATAPSTIQQHVRDIDNLYAGINTFNDQTLANINKTFTDLTSEDGIINSGYDTIDDLLDDAADNIKTFGYGGTITMPDGTEQEVVGSLQYFDQMTRMNDASKKSFFDLSEAGRANLAGTEQKVMDQWRESAESGMKLQMLGLEEESEKYFAEAAMKDVAMGLRPDNPESTRENIEWKTGKRMQIEAFWTSKLGSDLAKTKADFGVAKANVDFMKAQAEQQYNQMGLAITEAQAGEAARIGGELAGIDKDRAGYQERRTGLLTETSIEGQRQQTQARNFSALTKERGGLTKTKIASELPMQQASMAAGILGQTQDTRFAPFQTFGIQAPGATGGVAQGILPQEQIIKSDGSVFDDIIKGVTATALIIAAA